MKLLIDISEYNAEYIRNAYRVPQDINMVIAEAIINGKQIPTPHGRLIDADEIEMPCLETTADQKWMEIAIKSTPTVIKAEKENI